MLRGLVAAICAASLMAPPPGGTAAAPVASDSPVADDPPASPAAPVPAPEGEGWVDVSELEDEGEAETTDADAPPASPAREAEATVPPPTVESAGGLDETSPSQPRNVLGCRGNAGCVKLTAGGIVVSTLAAGTLAGGVVLTLKDDEVLPEDPTRMRTYRPAGEMMLTLGAGFLATGVLMLIASRYGEGVRDASTKRRRARRAGGSK